ncbi:PUL domain-containing protein [Coniochaeta sp. 2T2.1]|nr:PUL domain-containing protein [Coniochaeta sp. 2T2.1]
MDVHLLVYDLSGGLARRMSRDLLGFHLDAIYHTSIKLNGREYVYDGNVVSIIPGTSHLGRPLQEMHLGKTQLPMDVVEEYLDSLREIYTNQAYDLFAHNCNNFSNDLATFLLGKGIPDNILHMPQAVLDSPMGRMLLPTLTQQVNARKRATGNVLGIEGRAKGASSKPKSQWHQHPGVVKNASNLAELQSLLSEAERSCAVIFFTSAACAPCRIVYPLYDQLAAEFGEKATLIKVDISQAFDVASQYSVSATPTFITFLHGKEETRWSGADAAKLRGNAQLLVQMAWPPHPHQSLNLPTFSKTDAKPVLYTKVPPIHKLLLKMGPVANDPAVQGVKQFIELRSNQGPAEASLPDMTAYASFLRQSTTKLPPELEFAVVDLLRCGLVDPRFSGFFAEEAGDATVISLLEFVNALGDDCPYALRLVTVQTACNLFSSPLFPEHILGHERLRTAVTQLISSSFLDDNHSNVRVAAASLLYNVALANGAKRRDGPGDVLPEGDQVEMAAAALEAIAQEEVSAEGLQGMLLALGHLAYLCPVDGTLADLLRTMDAAETVEGKKKHFPGIALIDEVGGELLGKGLKRR